MLVPVEVRGVGLGQRSCRSIASGGMLGRSPERAPVNRPVMLWLRIVIDRLEAIAAQLAASSQPSATGQFERAMAAAIPAAKAKS